MEKVIIIRYCEIHLKGKNRGYFERLFYEGILFNINDIPCSLNKISGRYIIEDFSPSDTELLKERLMLVCGLHSFSVAYKTDADMDAIFSAAEKCVEYGATFKVETNRADKTFPLNSMEINRELGGRLLEKFPDLKVDVHNPQFTVNVDIRENGKAFVFSRFIKGIGGMPAGSSGRGMLLISGGIDSPVAGFMMAKRGMKIDAVHFHSYPYTNDLAKEKVVNLSKIISKYSCGLNLHVVSFTEIQEDIHKHCPEELMITIMRRFMMRIAEKIALKNKSQCLITGESLGQVASQTVEGMTSSNAVVQSLPVLRPLVAFDKLDIIDIAQKINTFEVSVLPYEDCCTVFLPKHPVIKPKIEAVEKAEQGLDIQELVERALQNTELMKL